MVRVTLLGDEYSGYGKREEVEEKKSLEGIYVSACRLGEI